MVETKVTTMVIKVDLGCEKCQKKIKRVLCAIPQIQNQTYDKKKNTVTITVVSRQKYTAKEVKLSSALRFHLHLHLHLLVLLLLLLHLHHHHAHVVKNAAEDHVVITFYLHIVMYLVEGQNVIYGEMDVVVAEVEVTMCAEVYMFMKSTIPRRHAQSCKEKVQKTDGLSQCPASTIGFKSSGHDGPLCCCKNVLF
ncbi:hypothetical protein NC651_014909 [Populus alba x Populus x berolinensis]|nr:hypothetical protein NC651_014909 [Populus alba x Populus x berolinensis]